MPHADDLVFIQNRALRTIFDQEGSDAFDLAVTELFIATAALITVVSGRSHLDSIIATIGAAQAKVL